MVSDNMRHPVSYEQSDFFGGMFVTLNFYCITEIDIFKSHFWPNHL